jgi:hypothetical protein
MKENRARLWVALVSLMVLMLAACAAPTPAATEAPVVLPDTPTAVPTGRITGRIEYQALPTPASALYAVNILDGQWFVYDLVGSDSSILFDIEVPAGMYQLYARQSDGGAMAAGYLNPDETLGAITVPAGQVISDVLLQFAAPQNLCQRTALPASPDGRFPAIDATVCPSLDEPTEEALATIRGTITYQAPPTPLSMLYFVSAERWYWLEVPEGGTFEWQVAPGTYQLYAFRVGSEGGSTAGFYRPSSYGDKTSGAGFVTVAAGQVVENILVQNINPDNCVLFPIPASPDGRFPALGAETCAP